MPTIVESAQRSSYGAWIEIRLDRFRSNLDALKKAAAPAQVMAVVKANAYGHGLVEMARAIKDQVVYLGVSSLHEVSELREHGIETPLFLFGRLFGQEIITAVKSGVTLSLSSLEEAQEISKISASLGRQTKIHIKVDTGMGRLGILERDALATIEKIAGLSGILSEGIYTHFPTAERGDGFMESQFQRFGLLIQELETRGISFQWRHASNSAASLKLKSPILNLVRPGLALYGILPYPVIASPDPKGLLRGGAKQSGFRNTDCFVAKTAPRNDVMPALSLKSRIMLLKRLLPGDSVGYGRDFKITEPATIATLPIGYSHGYPFHLSNKAAVLYRGKRLPVAGRVSMDFLCVNLGNTPAAVGEEVTLLGEDGGDAITAAEMAHWAGTIPYEIVTRLASRLPRIYRE